MKTTPYMSVALALAIAVTPTLGFAKENTNKHQGSCKAAWGLFLKNGWRNGGENVISANCRIPFGIWKKFTHGTTTPPAAEDTVAPTITSFTVNPNVLNADVAWGANENIREAVLFYGTTSPVLVKTATTSRNILDLVSSSNGSLKIVDNADNKASGSLTIKNLTASTTYYAVLAVRDNAGNLTLSETKPFTTDRSGDTTAPVLSAITTAISSNKLVVSWKTNEPATSKLFYGTTTLNLATASSLSSATLKTSHSFELPLLASTTARHIVVQSADASGNTATSSEYTVYSPF